MTTAASANRVARFDLTRLTNLFAPFLGLLFVLLIFSLSREVRVHFLSRENFRSVATQTVIVGFSALGMTLVIISGGIDLSVGSAIALTSVVAAVLVRAGRSPSLALLAAVFLGAIIGAVNGVLITRLRLTPFIVTLGMLGVVRGLAKWLAQDESVYAPKTWINQLAMTVPKPKWLFVSAGAWIVLGLAVVIAVMLRYSAFGRWIFGVGSNEAAARLSGLRVDAIKIGVYTLAGLFFGLAGVLQFARLGGQGDPATAAGIELEAIAAVVIGGGSLAGGEGSILGSIIGALMMSFLRNGSQHMGWPSFVDDIIIGAVIIVAVALDRLRHRRSAGSV